MDIREILNQLRTGSSDRQISQDMGIARQTVKRYRAWAKSSGLLAGEMPSVEVLQEMVEKAMPTKSAPQNTSSVESFRAVVKEMVEAEVEAAAIYQRLKERGFTGSYSGVYRFVRALNRLTHSTPIGTPLKPACSPAREAASFGFSSKAAMALARWTIRSDSLRDFANRLISCSS